MHATTSEGRPPGSWLCKSISNFILAHGGPVSLDVPEANFWATTIGKRDNCWQRPISIDGVMAASAPVDDRIPSEFARAMSFIESDS